MAMKNKKIILIALVIGLFTSGVVLGAGVVYLMTIETNGDDKTGLTAEHYRLLTVSIMQSHLEDMSSVELTNAWLILDAMREVDFVENKQPGQSAVTHATWILDMLGIGEIQKITVIEIQERFPDDPAKQLIMRIINEENNIYYLWYCQTMGLVFVHEDDPEENMIYSRGMNFIRDGQICHRITGECR